MSRHTEKPRSHRTLVAACIAIIVALPVGVAVIDIIASASPQVDVVQKSTTTNIPEYVLD